MEPLTIAVEEITPDLLRPEDSPVFAEALQKSLDAGCPIDGVTGFDSQLRREKAEN